MVFGIIETHGGSVTSESLLPATDPERPVA